MNWPRRSINSTTVLTSHTKDQSFFLCEAWLFWRRVTEMNQSMLWMSKGRIKRWGFYQFHDRWILLMDQPKKSMPFFATSQWIAQMFSGWKQQQQNKTLPRVQSTQILFWAQPHQVVLYSTACFTKLTQVVRWRIIEPSLARRAMYSRGNWCNFLAWYLSSQENKQTNN